MRVRGRVRSVTTPAADLIIDESVAAPFRRIEELEDTIRHVLRYGRLGKQSKRRLKEVLKNQTEGTGR